MSTVLQGLAQSRSAIPLPSRQIDQISGELFTSMRVSMRAAGINALTCNEARGLWTRAAS